MPPRHPENYSGKTELYQSDITTALPRRQVFARSSRQMRLGALLSAGRRALSNSRTLHRCSRISKSHLPSWAILPRLGPVGIGPGLFYSDMWSSHSYPFERGNGPRMVAISPTTEAEARFRERRILHPVTNPLSVCCARRRRAPPPGPRAQALGLKVDRLPSGSPLPIGLHVPGAIP